MTKTKTKVNRFLSWVGLTLLRLTILILGYTVEAAMYLFQFLLWMLFKIGKPLGITVKYFEEEEAEEAPTFEKKFSQEDIESLAKSVTPKSTIKEIEDQLGISYRQARKVKEAGANPLAIRNYRFG